MNAATESNALKIVGTYENRHGDCQHSDVYWKGEHVFCMRELFRPFYGKRGELAFALGVCKDPLPEYRLRILGAETFATEAEARRACPNGEVFECPYEDGFFVMHATPESYFSRHPHPEQADILAEWNGSRP